jgi:hypothetical protein
MVIPLLLLLLPLLLLHSFNHQLLVRRGGGGWGGGWRSLGFDPHPPPDDDARTVCGFFYSHAGRHLLRLSRPVYKLGGRLRKRHHRLLQLRQTPRAQK